MGDFGPFLSKMNVSQHIPTPSRQQSLIFARAKGPSAQTWRVETQCDKSTRPRCVQAGNDGTITHSGRRCVQGVRRGVTNSNSSDNKTLLKLIPRDATGNREHQAPAICSVACGSFGQVVGHRKSDKTPVNKGRNDFHAQKSPTSFGEEPKKISEDEPSA